MSDETKFMWLGGGQYHCDPHRPISSIPFFFAPLEAKCAECSENSRLSYLSVHAAQRGHAEDRNEEESR